MVYVVDRSGVELTSAEMKQGVRVFGARRSEFRCFGFGW